jgi:radical SAM protein with 4Fe4S-binding SPASM domain
MYTNGLLLNERIIDHVMQTKVNQLCISVDGATKATYERIRIGAKFERLIASIQSLNQVKKRLRSATPHLCFNVVLMRSNIRELPALVRLAHQMEVESIAAVHMVPLAIAVANPKEESLQWDKDLCNRMLDEARALAERYHIHITLPDRFGVPEDASPLIQVGTRQRDLCFLPPQPMAPAQPSCLFPWHFVGLDSDGNLMPCGCWHNQAPLGNVLKESFASIWNNEGYRKLRFEHVHGTLRPVCQTCPAAGMGNINHANAFLVR